MVRCKGTISVNFEGTKAFLGAFMIIGTAAQKSTDTNRNVRVPRSMYADVNAGLHTSSGMSTGAGVSVRESMNAAVGVVVNGCVGLNLNIVATSSAATVLVMGTSGILKNSKTVNRLLWIRLWLWL